MNITILFNEEAKTVKIHDLNILGIGCITRLGLRFNDGFNVICGANGIGKTTILNIIADAFAYTSNLKRNAQCEKGFYDIGFSTNGHSKTIHKNINKFEPNDPDYRTATTNSKYLLRFNTGRSIDYIKLSGILSDPKRDDLSTSQIALTGVKSDDIKSWFVNRYAFHDKTDSLSDNEIKNHRISINMFAVLDKSIKFKTVNGKSLDIILSTPSGDIYFEYLSSGYKSCIYIIMGIMKEIEYRFSDNPIVISDFDGCILIDEIEEHLHPTWQAQLVRALKKIFPNAQFIVTTHSPSILQSVDKGEIIPLCFDKSGNTAVNHLDLGEYALQGWTLEEILQDVMGMPATTSEIYQKTINAFDKAMYDEDIPEIKRNYAILDKMLHPNSTTRKLLQIQMVGLEE